MKQQEGNPRCAGRCGPGRWHQRNQMIRSVSMADVIVVNPTHYAWRSSYDRGEGRARGGGQRGRTIAAAIRAQGERHGSDLHEPVLTRTLYKACEIGQLIPADLYEGGRPPPGVVFSLRAKGRADGYHELPRRTALARTTVRPRRAVAGNGRKRQLRGSRDQDVDEAATDGAQETLRSNVKTTASDRSQSPPRSSASW